MSKCFLLQFGSQFGDPFPLPIFQENVIIAAWLVTAIFCTVSTLGERDPLITLWTQKMGNYVNAVRVWARG